MIFETCAILSSFALMSLALSALSTRVTLLAGINELITAMQSIDARLEKIGTKRWTDDGGDR